MFHHFWRILLRSSWFLLGIELRPWDERQHQPGFVVRWTQLMGSAYQPVTLPIFGCCDAWMAEPKGGWLSLSLAVCFYLSIYLLKSIYLPTHYLPTLPYPTLPYFTLPYLIIGESSEPHESDPPGVCRLWWFKPSQSYVPSAGQSPKTQAIKLEGRHFLGVGRMSGTSTIYHDFFLPFFHLRDLGTFFPLSLKLLTCEVWLVGF